MSAPAERPYTHPLVAQAKADILQAQDNEQLRFKLNEALSSLEKVRENRLELIDSIGRLDHEVAELRGKVEDEREERHGERANMVERLREWVDHTPGTEYRLCQHCEGYGGNLISGPDEIASNGFEIEGPSEWYADPEEDPCEHCYGAGRVLR